MRRSISFSGRLLQMCLNNSEIEPQVSDWQIVQIMVTLRKQINLWGRKNTWLVMCLKKYKSRVRFAKVKCKSEKEQTSSFKLKCKHRSWMLSLLRKKDLHPQKSPEHLLSGLLGTISLFHSLSTLPYFQPYHIFIKNSDILSLKIGSSNSWY